jgi:hypothetical protein
MQSNRLYQYRTEIDLVYTAYGVEVDNRNMNPTHVVAHRGLTNTIYFNVRDRDRKLQTITVDDIRCYIVDATTRRRVVSKLLEPDQLERGIAKLVLREGDIVNLVPGMYHCYFTITRDDRHEEPLYSNQMNGLGFTLEITDQAYSYPVETQEGNANITVSGLGDANVYTTSAMFGNLDRNFNNCQHTMAFHINGYTGSLKVQASNIPYAPDTSIDSIDWYDVKTTSITEKGIIVNGEVGNEGVFYSNFNVACNWLRVVNTPADGNVNTLTKIELRN